MKTKLARRKLRLKMKNGHATTKRNGYSLTKDFDSIKRAIVGATEHAKGKANHFIEKTISDARGRSKAVKHNVVHYAKSKPFKTIGLALLTGACLGFLIRK